MKKLTILLFSILISFNSYGLFGLFGLFETTVCVDTDTQNRSDIIYLPNKTKPFTGKNLCKYENGQNKSKGKVKDGKKNDVWTKWKTNGQKEEVKNYKNGKIIGGIRYMYYDNGQISSKSGYVGEEYSYFNHNGIDIWWYENGLKWWEGNWKNGMKDGKYTQWHENGQVERETNYKDDKLDGKQTYWYENGQKEQERNYKDDELDGKQTYWYENGQVEREENWNNKIPDGIWTYWFSNGQIGLEGNFKNGTGKFLQLHENNQKSLEVIYKDGLGKMTHWYENGQIRSETNFKNGKLDGKSYDWYDNGQKKEEMNWKDGHLDGKLTKWDEDGVITHEINF